MRDSCKRVTAAIFALVLVTTAIADNGIEVTYQEPLHQLQLMYASAVDEQAAGIVPARTLRFDAFGTRFDIHLEDNRTILDATQRSMLDERFQIYRGDIAGMPNSWVRLVVADNMPRGMLWDGTEMWAIEVETNKTTGIEEPFIYRLADLLIAPGTLACSGISMSRNAGEMAKAVLAEVAASAAQGPDATSQIDLAVIGDFEFTSDKGSMVNEELTTRMNNIDGIFSMQLGVQINVNRIDTYSSNNDPFTKSDAGELLDELTEHRDATPEQFANGLSHLFTGRVLDGSTAGIAWTEALCSRRFGAGLTQGTHTVTTDSLIAAHEIGHNFGAPHDGTSGSACESEPQTFLMAPSINGSDEFSACSITEMQDDIANAACITPLASMDVAVVSGGQPADVLLGDIAAVTYDVNSIGIDTVSGVTIDVTIPAGVTLTSVSATSGSCSSGGGTASCAIDSIAAGSGVTVTVDAEPTTVGVNDFVASVSANDDANSNNNQATVQLTTVPAVDLVSTAAATPQVQLDQSTTLRPTVANLSSIAATNVAVTVTLNSNIGVDSASWLPGSCSIDSNTVTCTADSLTAQSTNTLQIGVTGLAEGTQIYSMTVSGTETDRNPGNNDATGQLNVIVPTPTNNGGDGSSGSGSLGWLALLFLALATLGRSRRVAD